MGQKITVTKALCSLRGSGVTAYLASCSCLFHYPPLPMWRECISGKRDSPYGISAPGRINYFPTVHPPRPKDKRTREDRMIRAIDVYKQLQFVERCGLWLLSHVDLEDANLLWCLIQTSTTGQRPGFNFRDAAAYRARSITKSNNWKDPEVMAHIERLATLRKVAETQLRSVWDLWQPTLQRHLMTSKRKNPSVYKSYENNSFYTIPISPPPGPAGAAPLQQIG